MNSVTSKKTPLFSSDTKACAVRVSETFWGYIIRKGGSAAKRAAWGEIVAMVACIMFGIIAYSQWLLPGTINDIDVLPFKISGTIVFFVLGFLNYSIARKGLLYEMQIDQKREVLRLARRNRDGVSTLLEGFPFAEIERIYMQRSKSAFIEDRLYVEFSSRSRAVLVASGPACELEPLRERLIGDIKPNVAQQRTPAPAPKRPAAETPVRGAFAAQ